MIFFFKKYVTLSHKIDRTVARWGHPCHMDTFLVSFELIWIVMCKLKKTSIAALYIIKRCHTCVFIIILVTFGLFSLMSCTCILFILKFEFSLLFICLLKKKISFNWDKINNVQGSRINNYERVISVYI
jgi:hypothetical protein